MKKKVLILGAGNAQIDAIDHCKERGYEVVGCSYTTVDCGIPHLDYFEQIDIKNVEGIVELAEKHDVTAIYSVGSDLAMPTVMKASEALNLPHFVSSDVAGKCHSKGKMREALGTDFVGNIKYIVCSNVDDAKKFNSFPAMMKPVDSQGQRGCFRIDSVEDIMKHFETSRSFSFEGKVIIEEYIEGREISVNAYFQDSELRFAIVSDRYAFDEYPGGIIKEHRLPSSFADKETQAKAIDLAERVADRLGIKNGPCYYQIKLRNISEPIILEVTPRLDGCHMWNLIKHYCGADLLDACFSHLLEGRPVLTDNYSMPTDEYSLKFMCKEPNSSFDRSEFDISDAEYHCFYYETGDRVLKINGHMEKCGYIIKKTGRAVE